MENEKQPAAEPKPGILIIDDENGFRQMLSYAFRTRGFDVATAANGEEGVALARQRAFDVVVSDLTMPRMGGMEALGHLKAIDPTLEVIIVTGYATIETAVTAIKKGAFDYLTKPFQIDDLRRLVERALEKRRLNRRRP